MKCAKAPQGMTIHQFTGAIGEKVRDGQAFVSSPLPIQALHGSLALPHVHISLSPSARQGSSGLGVRYRRGGYCLRRIHRLEDDLPPGAGKQLRYQSRPWSKNRLK